MAVTHTLLASVTVPSGGAANIDFTSISSGYTDLLIKLSTRDDTSQTDQYLNINFNNDFGANYASKVLNGAGTSISSFNFSAQNNGYIFQGNANTSTTNTFSNIDIYIPNYTSSSAKSYSNDGAAESNTSAAGTRWNAMTAGLWSGTSTINRITISPGSGNFLQNTTAYLYGIKNS